MKRIDEQDRAHLARALRLAMNGRGQAEPNPMVGCVLVRDGVVIGEGWHARFGAPHAEPTALADCARRGTSPRGATAYVTLEPCCHTNKKTPPCAPTLIEAGIARVVVGCLDPNPAVNGNGVAMLRAAGVDVDVLGADDGADFRQLLTPFTLLTERRRPYVTVKWAETIDGRVAGPGGARMAISGAKANAAVHRLRARSDAIVVGIGTALVDDPRLTVRGVESLGHPSRLVLRVVLDRSLRLPTTAAMLQDDSPATLVIGRRSEDPSIDVRADELRAAGARVLLGELDPLEAMLAHVGEIVAELRGDARRLAGHVLIEAGPTLARSIFDANLCDRLWVIKSSAIEGDATAPRAADIPEHVEPVGTVRLGPDLLTEYLNRRSPAFAAGAASVDFVLERERAEAR